MLKKKPSKRLPSMLQIDKGCYIDFEGFAGNEHQAYPPPILVGVWNQSEDGIFKQYVFTSAYRWAAEDSGIRHQVVFVEDRELFLRRLVESTKVSKPLFAFSEYERTVIKNVIGMSISKRYKNVRSITKAWYSRNQGDFSAPASWKLMEIARGLEIDTGRKLQKGGVTDRFRLVREFSKSKRCWATAPLSIKEKWRELLEHNKTDVMLCHQIATKLRRLNR